MLVTKNNFLAFHNSEWTGANTFETLSAQALARDHHAPRASNARAANERASKKLETGKNLVVREKAGNFVTRLAGPSTSFTTVETTQNHPGSQLQALESSTGDGRANHNNELGLHADSDVPAGEFPAGELIRLHPINIFADVTLYVH